MKRRQRVFAMIVWMGMALGCEDTPTVSRGVEKPPANDGAGTPPDTPAGTPSLWSQIRLTMAREQTDSECGFQDFKIDPSGSWSFSRCDESQSGQLDANESEALDQRANAALQNTQTAPCPEVIIFNRHYIYLQSQETLVTFTYDPDGACYRGGEKQVQALREYLVELENRFRDSFDLP